MTILFFIGSIHHVSVYHLSNSSANQLLQYTWLQRVQFPALITEFSDITLSTRISNFRWIRRRIIFLNLIHIQGQPLKFNLPASEQAQPILNVPRHVLAARIVVAKMQDHWNLLLLAIPKHPLCADPHFTLAGISPAGEQWDIQLIAYALKYSC